jgi:hypothetical protein
MMNCCAIVQWFVYAISYAPLCAWYRCRADVAVSALQQYGMLVSKKFKVCWSGVQLFTHRNQTIQYVTSLDP